MKKNLLLALGLVYITLSSTAQSDTGQQARTYDTVIITAFSKQLYKNIPFNIQAFDLQKYSRTPRLQLMQQLMQTPSVSSISSGAGINKPVIRGLSFNQVQLFAQGVRIDNQSWDDRHDIGISDNGFERLELVAGPAALLYGPNTLGGAMILHDRIPEPDDKGNGYAQLGFHSVTQGGELKAGYAKGNGKGHFYYTLDASLQVHANYVQGKQGAPADTAADSDKPLAFNSKFTNGAFKGLIGFRKEGRDHQLIYNLYRQQLGIVEDESMEAINNPGKKEERDYEMEAPYQDVTTHILSTKNQYRYRNHQFQVNAGYQFNKRKEFEPGSAPKSKVLGVALDLHTITADLQYAWNRKAPFGLTTGIQGFFQKNTNTGNWVLVPDADIKTIGAYLMAHYDLPKWNFLAGLRIDHHQLDMYETPAAVTDTFQPPILRPNQQLSRNYDPVSASAGLVYHPTSAISIKLNLANGYTAPNYAQLTAFGRHEGTYRFEVGKNDLEMEKNLEADLSIGFRQPSYSLTLGAYNNDITGYVFIQPTADSVKGLRIYQWNQQDAVIRGAEFDLTIHPENAKWFEGFLRAAVTRGKLKDDAGDLPYIPATKTIAGLTFKKADAGRWMQPYISLQGSLYGKQSKVAAFEQETDGYFLADIFAGITAPYDRQPRWIFNIFCTNLFNKSYFNHLSLIKAIGVREPGRSIGVQVRHTF